jgi:hypothetical protein
MRSWLIGHQRLWANDASKIVRAGRVLEHFPQVAAGFADGSIGAAQVEVIADAVGPKEVARAAEQSIDLGAFDAVWARVARESTYEALKIAVQAFGAALDPDGPEPDPTEVRELSITKHADGSITGRFHFDAVGGEKSKDHPLPTTRKLAAGPWGWPKGAAERRCAGADRGQPAGSRQPADAADGEAARGRGREPRGPDRPVDRQGHRGAGIRRADLRRAGPLADL